VQRYSFRQRETLFLRKRMVEQPPKICAIDVSFLVIGPLTLMIAVLPSFKYPPSEGSPLAI
jgi:hypothetical protein